MEEQIIMGRLKEHHCMNDLSKDIKEKEQERFDKLCREFGMCMD